MCRALSTCPLIPKLLSLESTPLILHYNELLPFDHLSPSRHLLSPPHLLACPCFTHPIEDPAVSLPPPPSHSLSPTNPFFRQLHEGKKGRGGLIDLARRCIIPRERRKPHIIIWKECGRFYVAAHNDGKGTYITTVYVCMFLVLCVCVFDLFRAVRNRPRRPVDRLST